MNPDLPSRYFLTAAVLAFACFVATTLAVPYLLVMVPKLRQAPMPLPTLTLALAAQAAVPALGLAWIGLRLGSSVGLGTPVLRAWLANGRASFDHGPVAAGLGLGLGASMLLVDRTLLLPMQPQALQTLSSQVQPWRGVLAAFYGGIVEEVLVRLFLMTALVWIFARFAPRLPAGIFVTSAVIAGLLFAVGHLPAVAKIVPLDSVVVGRIVALNTLGGIVFGLVYWQWGLECAIVTHFCADIVLHSMGG